jgi:hypothetical protein
MGKVLQETDRNWSLHSIRMSSTSVRDYIPLRDNVCGNVCFIGVFTVCIVIWESWISNSMCVYIFMYVFMKYILQCKFTDYWSNQVHDFIKKLTCFGHKRPSSGIYDNFVNCYNVLKYPMRDIRPVKKTELTTGGGDLLPWPRDTLYPQKLALTSSTTGGRSVGIVRLRTKGHGVYEGYTPKSDCYCKKPN